MEISLRNMSAAWAALGTLGLVAALARRLWPR